MSNLDKVVGGFHAVELICFMGGRSGGKSWAIENNRKELDTKPLTQPEKKDNIKPSTLLVKLIGRI